MGTEKKYKYIIDLLLQSQGFTNNMNKVQSQMKGVESMAKKTRTALLEIGGALGFTYGIGQMAQLIKNSVELAAKAEGVKTAFNKIDNPNLLRNLRAATNNTVSDLELMAKTVQARNFKISMEALPTYFKFASQRAIETGQAVDYLVESLVVGVGRKSVLWLDNLGLSVTEINEELKKTPDFAEAVGKVIEREMKAAGTVAETTATKIQTITASWENLKVTLGESVLAKGGSAGLGMLSDWAQMISRTDLSGIQKMVQWVDLLSGGHKIQDWKEQKKAAEEFFAVLDIDNVRRYVEQYRKMGDAISDEDKYNQELVSRRYQELQSLEKKDKVKQVEIRTLKSINEELQLYNDLILETNVNDKATIKSHYEKIRALEAEKQAIVALGEEKRKLDAGPGKVPIPGMPTLGTTPGASDDLARGPGDTGFNYLKFADELERQMQMARELETIFLNVFSNVDEGFKGLADSMIREMKHLVAQIAAKAAVFGLLNMIPGFRATMLAGETLGSFLGIKKLAAGGLAYGPTIAQVGEYPGAKADPEVISPLSKLKGMIQGNQVMPSGMKLGLDGQGNLYAWLKYKERHLSNYK